MSVSRIIVRPANNTIVQVTDSQTINQITVTESSQVNVIGVNESIRLIPIDYEVVNAAVSGAFSQANDATNIASQSFDQANLAYNIAITSPITFDSGSAITNYTNGPSLDLGSAEE
jgi:hypothetical protein